MGCIGWTGCIDGVGDIRVVGVMFVGGVGFVDGVDIVGCVGDDIVAAVVSAACGAKGRLPLLLRTCWRVGRDGDEVAGPDAIGVAGIVVEGGGVGRIATVFRFELDEAVAIAVFVGPPAPGRVLSLRITGESAVAVNTLMPLFAGGFEYAEGPATGPVPLEVDVVVVGVGGDIVDVDGVVGVAVEGDGVAP